MESNYQVNILKIALVYVIACACVCVSSAVDTQGIEHLTSFNGISLQECFSECRNRISCSSLTYTRRWTSCQLYDQNIPHYIQGYRTPGVLYRSVDSWPELDLKEYCHNEGCTSGEKCEDGCKLLECPAPSSSNDTYIIGNPRNIGSKIEYGCTNQFREPVYPVCQDDGTWSIVSLICHVYNYAASGPNTYQTAYGGGIGLNVTRSSPVTLETCLYRCSVTSFLCFGVNYFPGNKTCALTDVQTRAQMTNITGWYHYSKNWPVSLYWLNNRHYNLTYEEGVNFCNSTGTTIASMEDLELANTRGYGMCACGWVKDVRSSMLSLQKPCGFFPAGVSGCGVAHKADVFCKNVLFVEA